ncbi:hypothetical protein OCU04_002946 [Sclerotinia nivalis]|uniref:Uncharacterized protein n=1 Tax=Sclerotinia nivalis TaxID=352851 RepID=A0A9X0DP34_9HELO|nr:hypothetical protein OCU04_002946 [Sclerotinia nivalis]
MGFLSVWKKDKSNEINKSKQHVDKAEEGIKSATANVGGDEDVSYHVNYDSDDENEALCLKNTADNHSAAAEPPDEWWND